MTSGKPSATSSTESLDSPRYEILQPLGEGANGRVFLARDRTTHEHVALKQLTKLDVRSVQRLKREFRALADLHHPNLVKVYDLLHNDAGWFLVMELIDGTDLTVFMGGRNHVSATRDLASSTLEVSMIGRPHELQELATLTRTFHQLAIGVHALHCAGMLHRDLKPGNVRISGQRVVVLDFGLVRELGSDTTQFTQDGAISGTPAYMAPEQAQAGILTEAADWYAVGVMLYEALSGELPVSGRNVLDLLAAKLHREPTPLPQALTIPDELRELCMELLRRAPETRPAGADIVARLGAARRSLHAPAQLVEIAREELYAANASQSALIGRDAELAQLRAAMLRSAEEPIVLHLRGSSGAGKTALLEHFLGELTRASEPEHAGLTVLHSRCYERDSTPFKALDGVIDALARHLSSMDELVATHLVPTHVTELTQLFPGFERTRSVKRLLLHQKRRGDVTQIRERGENALRQLVERLAATRALVIAIDDLHWGDRDSAVVLRDWVREALGPSLLILSYRSEEADTSPCLRAVLEPVQDASPSTPCQLHLTLSPLSDSDVEVLCHQRGSLAPMSPALVTRIVAEAHGNPFLARQLSALAWARFELGDLDPSELSLQAMVTRTSAVLPESARSLLDILAIAGRPVSPLLALTAAGITQEGHAQIHALQSLHLLRTRDVADDRLIEVYHDRIRQAVEAAMTASHRTQLHQVLLKTAEAADYPDPDWLHLLATGAGERQRALHYGTIAAARATSGFAFERAAELYTSCLTLCDNDQEAAKLWEKLALSLARCRRGVKAAQAYLEAAKRVSTEESVPLMRLASSHLLRSGRFEQGDLLMSKVFEAMHLKVPTSRNGLYAAIGWELARQAARGDRFTAAVDSMNTTAASECELYGTLAIETLHFSPLRAVLFQHRALRRAHDAGDAALFARALCLIATMECISGTERASRRTNDMLARAATLAERYGGRNVELELLSARAMCAMLLGRPADVLEPAYAADRLYEDQGVVGDQGEYYYMFAVRSARIGALQNLGRFKQANIELTDLMEKARATDNRIAMLMATFPVAMAEEVTESSVNTRKRLDQEREQLPKGEFGVIHLQHLLAVMRGASVTGDFAWAFDYLEQAWPHYLDSPVHRGAYLAYAAHSYRARLLLNFYNTTRKGDPEALVRADLKALARLPAGMHVQAAVSRTRSRIAYFRGDQETAVALLRKSIDACATCDFADQYERGRHALGTMLGGDEGAQLVAASLTRLSELGCSDPVHQLCAYHPELL